MKFKKKDIVIVSYPKSGNTWLKFIMCNLLHPEIQHDFDTVVKYCPTAENEQEVKYSKNAKISIGKPRLFKSHSDVDNGFPNVIYIFRDVRDVLVSFYYHQKKFNHYANIMDNFIEEVYYGAGWRNHVIYWSWLSKWKDNVILIGYEYMKINPNRCVYDINKNGIIKNLVYHGIYHKFAKVIKKTQYDISSIFYRLVFAKKIQADFNGNYIIRISDVNIC